MKTYIIGHKNPDTDALVSTITLANYFKLLGKDYIAASCGEANKETLYILNRFNLKFPETIPNEEKKVILIDTMEPAQIADEVKLEEIIAIYDHHNLAGLKTPSPITINTQPVGCTATIIAEMYKVANLEPDGNIAGALIATILSDTLKFSSPTTTSKDRDMVEWLNGFAKLDIDDLADNMFKAKSDISDVPTDELLDKDYKQYDMNGKKIGFGVWETVAPKVVMARNDEIIASLKKKKNKEGLDCIFFGVVDIFGNSSNIYLISDQEKDAAIAAFNGKEKGGLMYLQGVVSRKKQMIPPLEKYFADLK